MKKAGDWPSNFASPPEKTANFFGYEDILAGIHQFILGRPGERIAIQGLGGVGKTALAWFLSQQPEVVAHFQDGILWGRPVTYIGTSAILGAWAETLGADISHISRTEERASTVRDLLRDRRVLIILDGVSDKQAVEALSCGGHRCATILTTRSEQLALDFGNSSGVWRMVGLNLDQALTFLSVQAPSIDWEDFRLAVKDNDGYLFFPQALRMFAGIQKNRQTLIGSPREHEGPAHSDWEDSSFSPDFLSNVGGYAEFRKLIGWSLGFLPEKTQALFRDILAFAPEPDNFSTHAAIHVTGGSQEDLELLSACGLMDKTNQRLSLQPVIAESLHSQISLQGQKNHRRYYLDLMTASANGSDGIQEIYGQSMWSCSLKRLEENRRETVIALSAYQEKHGLWEDYRNCGELALQACKSHSLCQEEGRLCNNLGKATHMLGDVQVALGYYRLAEDLLVKDGDIAERALVLNNIASILVEQGEFEAAQSELLRAISLLDDQPGGILQAYLHNNLGKIYDDLSLPIQARDEYLNAISHLSKEQDDELEMTIRFNLSLVSLGFGRKMEALNELQKAVELEQKSDHPSYEADVKLLEKLQRELSEPKLIHWLRGRFLS